MRLYTDFVYDPDFTTVATPLAEVIEHKHSVCQDFAHLGIGCLRSMGLAARYVSGYIETATSLDQAELIGTGLLMRGFLSIFQTSVGLILIQPITKYRQTHHGRLR